MIPWGCSEGIGVPPAPYQVGSSGAGGGGATAELPIPKAWITLLSIHIPTGDRFIQGLAVLEGFEELWNFVYRSQISFFFTMDILSRATVRGHLQPTIVWVICALDLSCGLRSNSGVDLTERSRDSGLCRGWSNPRHYNMILTRKSSLKCILSNIWIVFYSKEMWPYIKAVSCLSRRCNAHW